jgi:hypothetical protein
MPPGKNCELGQAIIQASHAIGASSLKSIFIKLGLLAVNDIAEGCVHEFCTAPIGKVCVIV